MDEPHEIRFSDRTYDIIDQVPPDYIGRSEEDRWFLVFIASCLKKKRRKLTIVRKIAERRRERRRKETEGGKADFSGNR